ncbi:MAG: hypothetical protein RLZZ339_832 [Cyanobacteriota bacterium]|jgi:hypothetical protein
MRRGIIGLRFETPSFRGGFVLKLDWTQQASNGKLRDFNRLSLD